MQISSTYSYAMLNSSGTRPYRGSVVAAPQRADTLSFAPGKKAAFFAKAAKID